MRNDKSFLKKNNNLEKSYLLVEWKVTKVWYRYQYITQRYATIQADSAVVVGFKLAYSIVRFIIEVCKFFWLNRFVAE